MKRIFSIFKCIISLSTIFILSGCGIFGGTSEPITLNLTISASKKLNPDIEKRASPIVIRIYQLTQIDTFNNSDFFALYENDQSILAKDLKYREEIEIKPGQSSIKTLEINSTSKYIAVLAAFRDLDRAQWKSFLEIDPLNLQSLKIELGEFKVIIDTVPDN
ncbi:MAG: type VI secretion system lipoprotein TssJ [Methylomarinum sp.]|nr:type VI secretion system lipoprotein TssJ [Methylomarinum sp.]